MGWAHMQSVRAGAVATHAFVFAFCQKNSFPKTSFWDNYGSHVCPKQQFLVKERDPKIAPKKVPRQAQMGNYPQVRRLPGTRLACAFFKQETIVQATVETTVRKSDAKLSWVVSKS